MKLFKRIACAAMALTLCLGIVLPASAASKETAANLFREERGPDEDYVSIRIKDEEDPNYDEYVEVDLLYRSMKRDLTITKDAKLIESVKLTVAKNATLTVEEGATLTVLGELVIEGTLINRGTIIVGTKESAGYSGFADADERNELRTYVTRLAITNKGTVRNTGKMNIFNGNVTNYTGAILENSGTMAISNTDADTTGLKNLARVEKGQNLYGEIINNGKITVTSTNGIGIHNYKGAKFENGGEIKVTKKSAIKGTIRGNKPR